MDGCAQVRFDQDAYYRLASLLNVALFDTLHAWLLENIMVSRPPAQCPGALVPHHG